ncbi:hypothetical protein [Oenococcus sp.]|uniref:hypothetical protein n=1 Tax=Oenococcus sp. TaxID=1979414 RepID=UPI0039EA662D
MQKSVEIDGKKINLLSSGVTPIIYKAAFQRDYFSDIGTILEAVGDLFKDDESQTNKKLSETGIKSDDGMNFAIRLLKSGSVPILYNLFWTYAKNADGMIPKLEDWLKEFSQLAILDFSQEIISLLMSSLTTKKV